MKFAAYLGIFVVLLTLYSGRCNHISRKLNTEVCIKVPYSVDECYAESLKHPISPKSAKTDCLQRLMWFYEPEQRLTAADLAFFSTRFKSNVVNGIPRPQSGFRMRKEYRQLTDIERMKLHKAFQKLYEKGILQKFALLHNEAINATYGGAALLGWNRVFLARLEEELRHEDGNISLAYWDPTLDGNMGNAANSILFSRNLFGNSNGDVVTGPFANWRTARGKLWRDYASNQRGKLISGEDMHRILTRCNTDDIVFPLGNNSSQEKLEFVLEYHLNGGHNWVGGDMSDKKYAAFDPIFYMYRAFFDMLWEQVRLHQKTECGIYPETAYAKITGGQGHGPNDVMYGFDGFKNIDGLKNYWTDVWYKYERRPHCPNCGSKYLYCDKLKSVCVSHSRRNDHKPNQNTLSGRFGLNLEPFEPKVSVVPKRIVNRFEPSPLNNCKTRASAKQDAKYTFALTAGPLSVLYPILNHAVLETNSVPLIETIVPLDSLKNARNNKKPVNNLLPKKQPGTVKTTKFAAERQPHTKLPPLTKSKLHRKSQPYAKHSNPLPNTISQPHKKPQLLTNSEPLTIPQPPQKYTTHMKPQLYIISQRHKILQLHTTSEPFTIPQPDTLHTKPQSQSKYTKSLSQTKTESQTKLQPRAKPQLQTDPHPNTKRHNLKQQKLENIIQRPATYPTTVSHSQKLERMKSDD